MDQKINNQWLNVKAFTGSSDDHLGVWIEAFLIDRKAQNFSGGTLYYYQTKLAAFAQYCEVRAITRITQITPNEIRSFLFWLESTGHNPGGIHCFYRTVKTFLRWWESETDPEGWKNPIQKVKAPRVPQEALEPVSIAAITQLLETCKENTLFDTRDRAIILTLFDTGLRASELTAMDLTDYDQVSGEMHIKQGKGRKPRSAFVSTKTRRAIRAYLKAKPQGDAMWVIQTGERLTYWGLNEVISRRSDLAGIEKPELHSFRRAYALAMLRAGVDVYSLSKLMGHADLQVLTRYLKQTNEDLKRAHDKGSPVNNSGIR